MDLITGVGSTLETPLQLLVERKLGSMAVGKGCGTRDVVSASSQLPNSGLHESTTLPEKGA